MTDQGEPDAVFTGPSIVVTDESTGRVVYEGPDVEIPLRFSTTAHTGQVGTPLVPIGPVLVPLETGHIRVPGGMHVQWNSTGVATFHLDEDCGG
jgi:hypothetical protein